MKSRDSRDEQGRKTSRGAPVQATLSNNTDDSRKEEDGSKKTTNQDGRKSSRKLANQSSNNKSRSSTKTNPSKKDRNSRELATTISSAPEMKTRDGELEIEQETDIDSGANHPHTRFIPTDDPLSPEVVTSESKHVKAAVKQSDTDTPAGEEVEQNVACKQPIRSDDQSGVGGAHYRHVAIGTIQEAGPSSDAISSRIFCQDDDEINQSHQSNESGNNENCIASSIDEAVEVSFMVYPLGCCEFDETQLVSATGAKAIQKCILKLSNEPSREENFCWGLSQTEPIMMKLFDDHIQFIDITRGVLLRSQPIATIKNWAVDDENNFAFVVEDATTQLNHIENSVEEPNLCCYVLRSEDDDAMSWKVATKLNQEINKNREQMQERMIRSNRLQQMVEQPTGTGNTQEDADELDDLEDTNEASMNVRYIGNTQVPRASGIDMLNMAVDTCLAASKMKSHGPSHPEARIHVSSSSVIVENVITGEIIVECRIRYLTFMGISRRDIRWCGFVMQNLTNKTFVAHCFECYPTAGFVCEAIQNSCNRLYEKVLRNTERNEALNTSSSKFKIRETLAKTFSRIKLK